MSKQEANATIIVLIVMQGIVLISQLMEVVK